MTRADFSALWEQLLSEGTNSVTIDEVESRTGATRNAVYLGVKYAMDRKRLFSPARGLYVVVPPEYRSMGVVPATHFIDPLMNHLGLEYYLGLATAAGWWGSSHHASQEFQIIANAGPSARCDSGSSAGPGSTTRQSIACQVHERCSTCRHPT